MSFGGPPRESVRLRLPTLQIGPRSQGRNYDVLQQAGAERLSVEARRTLADFTLSLASWANARLSGFVAFFPLTAEPDSFALVRARYLGDAAQGTIAVANVALLDVAALAAIGGAAHQLLPAIPDPAAVSVGQSLLEVAAGPPGEARPGRLSRLGVAWRDRVLDVGGEDPEAVLVEALDAIEPVTQRARLTGWATTASLPVVGRFSPAAAFRLVTHGVQDDARLGDLPHLPMRLVDGVLVGEDIEVPEARLAWEQVRGLGGSLLVARALENLHWNPRWSGLTAADMTAIATVEACLTLDIDGQTELLGRLGWRAEQPSPASAYLKAGLQQALSNVLTASTGTPTLASYIAGYLVQGEAAVQAAAPVLTRYVHQLEVLRLLDETSLAALYRSDLLDAFAYAVTVKELYGLPAATAQSLLRLALQRAMNSEPQWRLARLLVVRLSDSDEIDAGVAREIEAVLAMIRRRPADNVNKALATRNVVRMAGRRGPEALDTVARHSLAPAFAAPEGEDDWLEAASASLQALQTRSAAS